MEHFKPTKLYNVIFPIWLLWLFPLAWLIVLPANFGIDLVVLVLTMKAMQIPQLRQNTKTVILRVWLMGFAADFLGTALMFLAIALDFGQTPFGVWWYDNITSAISFQPFQNVFAVLWVTICVAATGWSIYWLNRKFCLRNANLTDEQKRKLALSLAVFTAPYLFYLPTGWFY